MSINIFSPTKLATILTPLEIMYVMTFELMNVFGRDYPKKYIALKY